MSWPRRWRRAVPSMPAPPPPAVVVLAADPHAVAAEEQDATLELLGVVMLGEPELVREAMERVCRGSTGTAVSLLVRLLVEQLRRDGYETGVERLQQAAVAAKARREARS